MEEIYAWIWYGRSCLILTPGKMDETSQPRRRGYSEKMDVDAEERRRWLNGILFGFRRNGTRLE